MAKIKKNVFYIDVENSRPMMWLPHWSHSLTITTTTKLSVAPPVVWLQRLYQWINSAK